MKTNVIFIVLDDMGYSDLGCFGSEIDTKNLDTIAGEGLRYSNFTVCPACSPTRASLLTGRNHNSVGMGSIANVSVDGVPNVQGHIRHDAGTIAQVLGMNGYSTFAVGKWHVAPLHHETPAGPFEYWPLGKGFSRFYGYLDGETDQYAPQLICDNHAIDPPRDNGYHLSNDLVDKSIDLISNTVSVYPEKPFFLYLCFGVAHSPHQVPAEYVDRYKGKYDKGWDIIREERFNRQKKMGLLPKETNCTERDLNVATWDSLDEDRKKLYCRFQETYAGYITHCDEQIGRLLSFLREIDEYENTIFVILSDNGASRDGGTEGIDDFYRTLNGSSPSFDDLFAKIDDIGGPEMKALYPKGWAMVSNTPFKEYKGTNFGGGVRTPLIVRFGQEISDYGDIRQQMVDVEDVFPTVMDVLGFSFPEHINGIKQMPVHGKSFRTSFSDSAAPTSRTERFFKWANTFAMVTPQWKAVSIHKPGRAFEEDSWELYHLEKDFAESKDVAAVYPEELSRLKSMWWEQAPQYISVPIRETTPSDFSSVPKTSPANSKKFRFLPKVGRIGSGADPLVENKSHRVTVQIDRDSFEDDGVLVASGGVSGGYSLFIADNRLYYDMNNFYKHFQLCSNCELPVGKCEVSFCFEKVDELPKQYQENFAGDKNSKFLGIGRLYINGKEVGATAMQSVPHGFAIEGMDIGRDGLTPVSPLYKEKGDFHFKGKIQDVRIEITER